MTLGIALLSSLVGRAQPDAGLNLDSLRRMGPQQLADLFGQAEVGNPPVGSANGRMLYSSDPRFSKMKVKLSNAVWRGKMAAEDGSFINRWVGGIRAIDSKYTVGPSWIDGRPAVLIEYPPGTKLFGNLHDELREVAPGLYLGPIFDRCPSPKFRGYLALQIDPCRDANDRCRRRR